MKSFLMIIFVIFSTGSMGAFAAPISVVTSTQTLASLIKSLGGEYVKVDFLSRGTEDPHYVEAKPSFMVKTRDADLVVVVGLELEKAWIENVLIGSRNPKVLPGHKGHLDLSAYVEALGKTEGRLDRSQGDVHPLGNPHYYLDPIRIKNLLPKITEKLSELQPENKSTFETLQKTFSDTLEKRTQNWQSRIQKLTTKNVVTYHKTLIYFLDRFGLTLESTIEPKPGIPPSVGHSLEVIKLVKARNITCILNESHFESTAAHRISKATGAHVSIIPTEVGALPNTETYLDLIEKIVEKLEGCK